jgi:chromosome segregation ATPase
MKINKQFTFMVSALALVFAIGTTVKAQTRPAVDPTRANLNSEINVGGVNAQTETRVRINDDKDDVRVRVEERDEVRSDIRDARNDIKDVRKEINDDRRDIRASTTARIKELNDDRKDFRASTTARRQEVRASTTLAFKALKDERGELIRKMKTREFEMRKNALVAELNLSLKNLVNIRARISDRITMIETQGMNVTEAKANLLVADDKLAKARVAVDLFASTNVTPVVSTPTTSPSPATGEAEVNLDNPRKIGNDAIKAVKDARDALRKTLNSIPKIQASVNASSTTSVN